MKRWQLTAPFNQKKEKKLQRSERLNQELVFLSDKKRFNLRELMDNFQISKRADQDLLQFRWSRRDIFRAQSYGAAKRNTI